MRRMSESAAWRRRERLLNFYEGKNDVKRDDEMREVLSRPRVQATVILVALAEQADLDLIIDDKGMLVRTEDGYFSVTAKKVDGRKARRRFDK